MRRPRFHWALPIVNPAARAGKGEDCGFDAQLGCRSRQLPADLVHTTEPGDDGEWCSKWETVSRCRRTAS